MLLNNPTKLYARLVATLAVALPLFAPANALNMVFDNEQSRNAGLQLLAKGLMDYYTGNNSGQSPGMFSWPYYWWEAGAAWNSMLDYWFYTGDDTWNDLLMSSLLYQTGPNWNYMPENQTTTEGNDDQGFWGVTVMAAAEKNFTDPGPGNPSWAYLAQAVFNTMAWRWDTTYCNGGLRWQIFTWNNGYTYKNSVSNGCLFQLAARLARYTGNDSYVEWAEKTWDWVTGVSYINTSQTAWPVYDGAFISDNCTSVSNLEWTYNSGLFLAGCAYLYNYTGDAIWLTRLEHIWDRSKVFFMPGTQIMYEAACQPTNRCNNDQRSFKAIFSRFLGLTCLMAPTMSDEIQSYLLGSTAAVLQSCTGGTDGHTCGLNWGYNGWDGNYGLGEQMSALELLQNRLVWTKPPPATLKEGATSVANGSSAGSNTNGPVIANTIVIHNKDKVGAGILTAVVLLALLAASWWMVI